MVPTFIGPQISGFCLVPRIQGPRTKEQGPRTKKQGPRTKDCLFVFFGCPNFWFPILFGFFFGPQISGFCLVPRIQGFSGYQDFCFWSGQYLAIFLGGQISEFQDFRIFLPNFVSKYFGLWALAQKTSRNLGTDKIQKNLGTKKILVPKNQNPEISGTKKSRTMLLPKSGTTKILGPKKNPGFTLTLGPLPAKGG